MLRSGNAVGAACLVLGACTGPDRSERGKAGSVAWDGSLPSVPIEAGTGCDLYVADPLIAHSCFHATVGPYRDRVLDVSASATEVSRAHTAFRLVLPPSGEGYSASVRYDARFSGGYALFTSPHVEMVLSRGEGAAGISSFADHDTEICPELPWVEAFQLAAGEHWLRIQSAVPDVMLVIEFMDDGAVENSYRTSCAQPDSFTMPDARADGPDDASSPFDDSGADGDCWLDPVLEHACLHVTHGPFAQVMSNVSSTPPNVNAPHTAFTVSLPPGMNTGHLSYRPAESGEYVFYLGANVELALHDSMQQLNETFRESIATCAGLEAAFVYNLVGATEVDLSLIPTASVESTILVVEHVDSLVSHGFPQRLEACE